MHTPLLPAPITPEIEQAIGQAPMVPLTALSAFEHCSRHADSSVRRGIYLHRAEHIHMDLSPWVACTCIGGTFAGPEPKSISLNVLATNEQVELQPLDTVYVTREAFERKLAGVRTAA
ncbi:MAG: hypothetical protein ABF271_12790 [Abyssibacter sp.]|jgi:hypothetical protein|uniref:hypothetical protein n=1 Tax=Abyssibacter sp. TaxID=2320200 RepID=UPI00321C2377